MEFVAVSGHMPLQLESDSGRVMGMHDEEVLYPISLLEKSRKKSLTYLCGIIRKCDGGVFMTIKLD
jgi:hypothetical protein